MTPLRAQMIHAMQLQRLAPKTQKAYVTAVASLAKFYQCSPDRLRPEQIRTYLHCRWPAGGATPVDCPS